ncbi:MAG TPA: hypothetical protein VMB79_03740 [Jatrophihabitans sp.]|nr:hypothetical protein [Jatrophihabitans sp.]
MSTHSATGAAPLGRRGRLFARQPGLRHLLPHLLVPVYLALGMALAYLGGFHRAEPHHLPVAVVGSSPPSAVLATTIGDRAGAQLAVRTVPDASTARAQVRAGTLTAAYLPGPGNPTVIVDSAASPSAAQVAETVFDQVAATADRRLTVSDLEPLPATDLQGSNLFFLLVALTVGGYTAAATLGVAGAAARVPYWLRSLLGVLVAGVIAVLGVTVAEPVVGAVHGHFGELVLLAWLYVGGVALFGSALHAFFGRLTTAVLVTLFVMLNFTSSGGVFDGRLQAGVFSGLANVWNGSAFLRAGRGLLYRGGTGVGYGLWVLAGWLAAGVLLVATAALVDRRRAELAALATAYRQEAEQEELDEGVAA